MAQMARLNGQAIHARDAARLDPVPAEFECLGHAADGTACSARLTLRAAGSKVVSPYFGACAGAPHVDTCDAASRETPPPEPAEDDGSIVTRNPRNGPTTLKIALEVPRGGTARRSTHESQGEATGRVRSRAEPTNAGTDRGRYKTLNPYSVLKRLMGGAPLGVADVQLPDGRTLLADKAIVPINGITPDIARTPRYFWGVLTGEAKAAGQGGVVLRVHPSEGKTWQETPAILVPRELHDGVLAALGFRSYSKRSLSQRGVILYGRHAMGRFPWITLASPLMIAFSRPQPQ